MVPLFRKKQKSESFAYFQSLLYKIDEEISFVIGEEKRTRDYFPKEKMILSEKEVYTIRQDFAKRLEKNGLHYEWENFLDSCSPIYRNISTEIKSKYGTESLQLQNLPQYKLLSQLYKNIDGEVFQAAKYSSAVRQLVNIVEKIADNHA